MSSDQSGRHSAVDLRMRALSRLTEGVPKAGERADSFAAFQALYELASSPATAPRALALLHELQVHQVELELQDEELRRGRAELEAALRRQTQLYDLAPVACFTIDLKTAVTELNLTGARLLGADRGTLIGQRLDSFLTAASARELHALLARVGPEPTAEPCILQLVDDGAAGEVVRASVARDPDGGQFLVALLSAGPDDRTHSS